MTPGKVNNTASHLNADGISSTKINDNASDEINKSESNGNDNNSNEKNGGSEIDLDGIESSAAVEEKISNSQMNSEMLLGSLTLTSSPAVRTSARVIQKMKLDSIRPTTPPPTDKKDGVKDDVQNSNRTNAQKTPNQARTAKTIWSTIEKNLFFDGLNEFGKDFEAIAHYINSKQKRKNATDPTYKAKEHVRLLYYQTFTKISKYLRFSDGKLHFISFYFLFTSIFARFRCHKKGSRALRADQLRRNASQSSIR